MIRTVIEPQNQNISITLPKDFIGRRVEVIAFTIDEDDAKYYEDDRAETHFASQSALAKEWLTSEEDLAWKDL
jgi:hypothetical protein